MLKQEKTSRSMFCIFDQKGQDYLSICVGLLDLPSRMEQLFNLYFSCFPFQSLFQEQLIQTTIQEVSLFQDINSYVLELEQIQRLVWCCYCKIEKIQPWRIDPNVLELFIQDFYQYLKSYIRVAPKQKKLN